MAQNNRTSLLSVSQYSTVVCTVLYRVALSPLPGCNTLWYDRSFVTGVNTEGRVPSAEQASAPTFRSRNRSNQIKIFRSRVGQPMPVSLYPPPGSRFLSLFHHFRFVDTTLLSTTSLQFSFALVSFPHSCFLNSTPLQSFFNSTWLPRARLIIFFSFLKGLFYGISVLVASLLRSSNLSFVSGCFHFFDGIVFDTV